MSPSNKNDRRVQIDYNNSNNYNNYLANFANCVLVRIVLHDTRLNCSHSAFRLARTLTVSERCIHSNSGAVALSFRTGPRRTIYKLRHLYRLLNRLTFAITDENDFIYLLSCYVGQSLIVMQRPPAYSAYSDQRNVNLVVMVRIDRLQAMQC